MNLLASMGNVVGPQYRPLIMVWFIIITILILRIIDALLLTLDEIHPNY